MGGPEFLPIPPDHRRIDGAVDQPNRRARFLKLGMDRCDFNHRELPLIVTRWAPADSLRQSRAESNHRRQRTHLNN